AEHLIYNSFDAQAHTGKLMKALKSAAAGCGVEVLTGASARSLQADGNQIEIRVPTPGGEIGFRAGRVAVCTNAFLSELLPEVVVTPARGQVLITRPVEGLRWRGTFNFDRGYSYFRNVGDRIIVGGARNQDRETETTRELAINPFLHSVLEGYLRDII